MATTPESPTTPSETAQRFPEAASFARAMREVFGPSVRLTYARNAQGEEIGKPVATQPKR